MGHKLEHDSPGWQIQIRILAKKCIFKNPLMIIQKPPKNRVRITFSSTMGMLASKNNNNNNKKKWRTTLFTDAVSSSRCTAHSHFCHDAPVPQKHNQDNLYRGISNEKSLLLLQVAWKTPAAAASSLFVEK